MQLDTTEADVARFDYRSNLRQAGSFGMLESAFWPPATGYDLRPVTLAPARLGLVHLNRKLSELRQLIELEWQASKTRSAATTSFKAKSEIAQTLRALARELPEPDQHVLELRADCVEFGYDDARVAHLMAAEERVAIVAGQISTWYGKEARARPTAFGSVRDDTLARLTAQVTADRQAIDDYLGGMHKALSVRDIPNFVPSTLFFMAGEGNLHPKHIAYFLPEDEGVKKSAVKKTYYFANTHAALATAAGQSLLGRIFPSLKPASSSHIPPLGVLAHEVGHFILRPETSYGSLNKLNRWVSITLQEAAADIFGTLILAEIWAPSLGLTPDEAIAYHLAECLRYVCRGLGLFPDSDGMFLQLNFFAHFDAIRFDAGAGSFTVDVQGVIACLRAMARVLADTLLYNNPAGAVAFHDRFGPASDTKLGPLLAAVQNILPYSVDYRQEETA